MGARRHKQRPGAFPAKRNKARSSAVAVIADRTAYNVRYTGKLSHRFRLQVYERLIRTIQINR